MARYFENTGSKGIFERAMIDWKESQRKYPCNCVPDDCVGGCTGVRGCQSFGRIIT